MHYNYRFPKFTKQLISNTLPVFWWPIIFRLLFQLMWDFAVPTIDEKNALKLKKSYSKSFVKKKGTSDFIYTLEDVMVSADNFLIYGQHLAQPRLI